MLYFFAIQFEFGAYENSEHIENHDFAIIQLSKDIPENATDVKPACLPQDGEKMPNHLKVYGWGRTYR